MAAAQRVALCSLVLVAVFVGSIVIAGCQTPGQIVAVEEDVNCPVCKNVTRTTSIKGMNFKINVCPQCEKQYRDVWDGYTSGEVVAHVCDKCNALVELCPVCRKH